MGTRARIAMQLPSGNFKSIYTHWDGYPSHHGVILQEHYRDLPSVEKLIALGDLSCLAEKIGEKVDFDTAPRGQCVAYGRDRGETGVSAKLSKSMESLCQLTQNCGGEYLYVFMDHQWYCAEGGIAFFGGPANEQPSDLRPLSEVLAAQAD